MLDLLSAFGSLTTLNCVFFLMLLGGIIWTAIVLIGGVIADIDLPDMDVDVPHIDLPGDIDIPQLDLHQEKDTVERRERAERTEQV